jgi:amino acid transporter
MNRAAQNTAHLKRPVLKSLYLISLFFLTVTGFGQIPIYKRYYIADLPGLGWLADFYITHFMHYLFAAVLIAVFAYSLTSYFLIDRKNIHIDPTGLIRGLILAGVLLSGVFLVVLNFRGVSFPQSIVIFLALTHMGLVVLFLLMGLLALVFRWKWIKLPRSE